MDWANPDYVAIFRERLARLQRIRSSPGAAQQLMLYYRDHPWQMITDWGVTVDPRNVERKLPAMMPFILFDKQIEWCKWAIDLWHRGENGATEKSRDMGVTWLAVTLSSVLCLTHNDMAIGFGSRKEEYVDGGSKAIFPKARDFIENLPPEFRGGWIRRKHSRHMGLWFPETKSLMEGEAGDNIGRGDRKSIYFVDEAAHIQRPELVDSALSATTNCRMDISSVKGLANSFAQRRFSSAYADHGKVFTMHWRSNPMKTEEWYAKQLREYDSVVVAQEIDIDYTASVEGVLVPSAWVQAAIDSDIKLGIPRAGAIEGALDVADEGKDKNAFAARQAMLLMHLDYWSGKGSDIFATVQRAFALCDALGIRRFRYDSDGLGSGVRGDARKINELRSTTDLPALHVTAFRGSAAVARPEAEDVRGRQNKDYFSNAKAQSWWHLRTLFQNTHRAVVEGKPFDPDQIISIDSQLPSLLKLTSELMQPTYKMNNAGRIVVDKAPDGMSSPNLADSVMMLYSEIRKPFAITETAMHRFSLPKPARAAPIAAPPPAAVAARRGMRISPSALGMFRGRAR